MDTFIRSPLPSRGRRRHTAEFKAQAVAACLQPGVSIAAVALANGLNANLLRSWVKAYRDRAITGVSVGTEQRRREETARSSPPNLVPISLRTSDVPPAGDIRIDIRREQSIFQITWPTSQAAACAQWLREILR